MKTYQNGITRRELLQAAAGTAAALPILVPGSALGQEKKAAAKITDESIFNFVLNLESLETEYYLRGTTGKGMDDADAGPNPGAVTGGNMVPWQDDDLRQFMGGGRRPSSLIRVLQVSRHRRCVGCDDRTPDMEGTHDS